MGKNLIIQGVIILKDRVTKNSSIYELKTDPIYPDDNIRVIVSINDIDMKLITITLRSDKSNLRRFHASVPMPKNSKLQLKIKLSKFAILDDYEQIRLDGYAFLDQTFSPNMPLEKVFTAETVRAADIEVGNNERKPSRYVATILDSAGMGISDFDEVATRLIHITELVPEVQKRIHALHLDMTNAILRCEAVHKKCVVLNGTMAVKACPPGYNRVGCCKCSLPCDTTLGYSEDGLFCKKPGAYTTQDMKFMSLDECVATLGDSDKCELHGNMYYTKKCNDLFIRSGDFDCLPLCPFGWPDYGDKCAKVGSIYCGMPSPWLPGDQVED